MLEVNRRYLSKSPNSEMIGFLAAPGVSLTSGGADPITQQTVLNGVGGTSTRRGNWNRRI